MGPASFLLLVAVLTAAAAYLWGRRVLRLETAGLKPAVAFALECVGLWVVFAAANLACGLGLALASRALGGPFVSTYWAADTSLLVLSLFEALLLQGWRGARARASGDP